MNAIDAAQLAFDPQALGRLKGQASRDEGEALKRVAREFEALLLNQLMKTMRDAGFGDELFGSETTKTFTGMLDQQYVHAVTRGPGLGLADTIVKQVEYLSGGRVKEGAATAVNQTR